MDKTSREKDNQKQIDKIKKTVQKAQKELLDAVLDFIVLEDLNDNLPGTDNFKKPYTAKILREALGLYKGHTSNDWLPQAIIFELEKRGNVKKNPNGDGVILS